MNIGEIRLTDDDAGTWKASDDAPPVSNEEYDTTALALERYLGQKHVCGWSEGFYQCYIRGDNFGDRTQDLQILDPEIFSLELITYLQAWIQDFPLWRIVTPCHLGKENLVVIYPQRVRFIADDQMPLEEYVSLVQGALVEYEKEHPLLKGRYRKR